MNKTFQNFFRGAFVTLAAVLLAGCGTSTTESYKINLEVWGTFDDTDAFQEVFSAYQEINPHIGQITYRKLPVESYKQDIIDALASGNGPDIFLVRNAWMGDFHDKMLPAPADMIGEKLYRDTFPDVATTDFIREEGAIYAAPLSIDSLALYYNKDIFNANGIARAPVTWEEVEQLVPRLTQMDALGNITQSAIAMGTSQNINRSPDILTAILYQKKSSILNSSTNTLTLNDSASADAVRFYTQFSDIRSPLYTWNPQMHYSLDAFYEGSLAMMVNYSWQYPALKQKNAKLNIGVAPLPQFAGTEAANQANYWAFGVAKNKSLPTGSNQTALARDQYDQARSFESWQFLKYFTMAQKGQTMTFKNAFVDKSSDIAISMDPAASYLAKTGKPAARRDLIAGQQQDVALAAFASGNLIAKNWFQGNVEAAEGVIGELIDTVYTGRASISQALNTTAQRLRVLAQ